jgi:uridine kinase
MPIWSYNQKIISGAQPGHVILIGGLARLGKSTLANSIAEDLKNRNLTPVVVSLDRWIRSFNDRVKPGVENRFDIDAVRSVLAPWLADCGDVIVSLPKYDRITRNNYSNVDNLTLSRNVVLILEGVPALLLKFETRRPIHRIYVTGSEDLRKRRVVSDLIARGTQTEDEAYKIYESREIDESSLIRSTEILADFVVTLDDSMFNPERLCNDSR